MGTLSLLILFRLIFWMKIFNYNLESNYFLRNFLKVIISGLLFWCSPSLLQPLLLAMALFFERFFDFFVFICRLFCGVSPFLGKIQFFVNSFLLYNFFENKFYAM